MFNIIDLIKELAEEYENDSYWNSFYMNIVNRNYPTEMMFSNNIILIKNKKKYVNHVLSLDEDEAKLQIHQIFSSIFRTNSNTSTMSGEGIQRRIISNYNSFVIYVNKMKKEYNLNDDQYEMLLSQLCLYDFIGVLDKKSMVMENGEIKEISSITYDSGEFIFDLLNYKIDDVTVDHRTERIGHKYKIIK